MIIVDDERVKIKGNEVEVADDFASIVLVLRDGFGKELQNYLHWHLFPNLVQMKGENHENYKSKRNN